MAISRHDLRIKAFELIFQCSVISADEAIDISRIEEPEYYKKPYVEAVVNGVYEKREEIDNIISSHLKKNWSLERLPKVVRTVLRLAVFEMIYSDDVPPGVAINEAVEITKQYGDEKDPSFVNGLLASVYKEIKNDTRD